MKAIVTYHSIDHSGSAISVDPETFRRQMRWIVARRVPVVDMGQLLKLQPETDALSLTFDDGFENFEAEAWPVLRDLGIPATLFVATQWVGRTNGWGRWGGVEVPELPLSGWAALGRMAEGGLRLGSHSRTHPDLRELEESRLVDEVSGASEEIARETGQKPNAFAYPYGAEDDRVRAAVRTLYDVACTTELRLVEGGEDRHRLPRLDAFYLRRSDRLEQFGTRSFRRYISLRNRMRRARRILMKGVDG